MQESATPPIATLCAPTGPMRRPRRPAMMAATSGSSTMAMRTCGLMRRASSLQSIEVFDVDGAALAKQHDQDRKADGRFRCGDGEHEEHDHLAADIAQIAREGDEVEIRREQQELDAHQEQNDILAVDEYAGDRERKQDPGERQQLCQSDHGALVPIALTRRTRSVLFTLTWRLIS